LVKTSHVDQISEEIAQKYEQATGIKPSLFVTRPASGATVLKG